MTLTVQEIDAARGRVTRMRAGVMAAAYAIDREVEDGPVEHRKAMVTLTYRPGAQWSPKHVSQLLDHYSKWFKRRGYKFRAVWVLETTAAGAPHYHIVCWFPKVRGCKPPLPDRAGWWKHGMTQAVWAKSPVGYIAKYASKGQQGALPKGARLWGAVGLSEPMKDEVRRALAPRWLRKLVSTQAMLKRVMRELPRVYRFASGAVVEKVDRVAGWLDRVTGLIFLSPYERLAFSGRGLALHHQGFVEAFTDDGDFFTFKA